MKIGRVYKIISSQGNECYVGSTFNTLRDRFKVHKYNYTAKNNKCSVIELFNKYGIDNCKCILIKEYKVNDRRHLEVYETLWIKKLKSINKNEPCGGLLIREKMKQYSKIHNFNHKEEHKQYYQDNKEEINNKVKLYYEANKEIINAKKNKYGSQRIICECGTEIRRDAKHKHIKTKKHLNNLPGQA